MFRKTIVSIVILSLLFLGSFSSNSEAEKAIDFKLAKAMEKQLKVKEVVLKSPFFAAHRSFINTNILGTVTFCGVDVGIEKVDEKNILVKWGGDKSKQVSKKKGGTVKITSGDEEYLMAFFYDKEKGWAYYNAIYREVRLERGSVRFFDINCNGKYLDTRMDCVMYGDCSFVSPIMPTQWYFDWTIEMKFFKKKKKTLLNVKYIPVKILPAERKAGINLNKLRMEIGLPAVPLGEDICRKAREYARFIDTQGGDTGDWEVVQNPKPGQAGYTPACSEMKGSYFFCFDGAEAAILDMFTQFYHRAQFFFPDTKEFGIGSHYLISVFNGERTRDKEYMPWKYPILLPAPEQVISHVAYFGKYGGETPSASPNASGSFPISIIFENRPEKIKVNSFFLKQVVNRKEIEVSASCYWPGRGAHPSQPDNQGQILVMGDRAFKRSARYHVVVEYTIDDEKQKVDWYFNTSKR